MFLLNPAPTGTGCIFHYDDEFPQGSGKGFKEADKPNFTGSYYSYTKVRRPSLIRGLELQRQGNVSLSAFLVAAVGCECTF